MAEVPQATFITYSKNTPYYTRGKISTEGGCKRDQQEHCTKSWSQDKWIECISFPGSVSHLLSIPVVMFLDRHHSQEDLEVLHLRHCHGMHLGSRKVSKRPLSVSYRSARRGT